MIIDGIKVVLNDILKRKYRILPVDEHINLAVKWLCYAQDQGTDDGVAEGYHLVRGWLPSYPETTGYIAKTFFQLYEKNKNEELLSRARKMLNWTCGIIDKHGAITNSQRNQNMVFDTGQVLLGLIEGYRITKSEEYLPYIKKLSDWLIEVQDDDGTWRKYSVNNIPHTYYSRVAWALAEAGVLLDNKNYIKRAKNNGFWVLKNQGENGWFQQASFREQFHQKPFTHTIAYTIRGLLQMGLVLNENEFIDKAILSLSEIYKSYENLEIIPSTLDSAWKGPQNETCLTGDAQLSILYQKISLITGEKKYKNFALKINNYLCVHQVQNSSKNISGALAGSYPIWGSYIHYCFPNWAVKFFIDALMESLADKK
jgi:uncharacterized protein YyaL (SSP411 family)